LIFKNSFLVCYLWFFFEEDTQSMQDMKDHFGSLEECRACPNFKTKDCYYSLTGIPGKCEHFYLKDFDASVMLK